MQGAHAPDAGKGHARSVATARAGPAGGRRRVLPGAAAPGPGRTRTRSARRAGTAYRLVPSTISGELPEPEPQGLA
ncbi:hypothetical protein GCM10018781_78710 [Kitasatospora indigofera]|uniref:Uncharacterized protein n=1 Tax=Kitasatospora indigofera TaxID=67307 RepID=A0A919D9I7_9ACTN|nr:hypothetical protein GCM10018781_78710 [Kitasatospora indigofera]